ncbi:xanthine dehydrogenase subunit E [Salibacterium salarium]|uniref:Xanthine dehydrogenase subunit E n=1 Tax=Salibacterium salarium TaxID=284579 RepID=A0A428N269_9BACI|nr:xanthine dehydrogenase subunit E [Salibacterium salarium]RSL32397.1 xanthine dehydrogenase subunit E [Salibacterium salarium]
MDTRIEEQPNVFGTSLSLSVNGQPMQVTVDPSVRLVDILRETLFMTGTKISCGIGRCGACSVMMDGKLVNSCLVMAYQAQGTSITTIEGVGEEALDPVQTAFLEEGGFQCGYCTPGMIMAVKALLKENPNPTDEEIAEGLSGNICRCTGYSGIIRSVRKAIDAQ